MTIEDCPKCGGVHYGSTNCPFDEDWSLPRDRTFQELREKRSDEITTLRAALSIATRERDEAVARVKYLTDACSKENDDISQTLGKALGAPWFKDDQVNFPGATEANGVCVGDHVAASLADVIAREYREAVAREGRMRGALDRARDFVAGFTAPQPTGFYGFCGTSVSTLLGAIDAALGNGEPQK